MKPVTRQLASAILLSTTAFCGHPARAQNFGNSFQREKIVLTRKLPPTGHIDGSTIKVVVTGQGIPADLLVGLKSTVESMLINNDSRLRTDDSGAKPDASINVHVTTYSIPPAQRVQEQTLAMNKNGSQTTPMTHVTGLITTTFEAQNTRAGKSIAADTVTIKFDREYPVPPPPAPAPKTSGMGGILSHIPGVPVVPATPVGPNGKQAQEEKPPTAVELRDRLIHDMAFDIASRMVNTTEEVPVFLAKGPGLDDADKLMEQKLWTRALEQLETMQLFSQPDADAYRLYDLGVVNEALAYQAEEIPKAKKFLQEASIDYGKAIDAKPAEKYFLQPQTRIDTALAHYKVLGDRAAAASAAAAAAAAAAPPPAADTMTNDDVIALVTAKLDQANIIDTIQHASAVKFDLTTPGLVALAKAGVNGQIIAAMKSKARGPQ